MQGHLARSYYYGRRAMPTSPLAFLPAMKESPQRLPVRAEIICIVMDKITYIVLASFAEDDVTVGAYIYTTAMTGRRKRMNIRNVFDKKSGTEKEFF
jgi:hypothetical protein